MMENHLSNQIYGPELTAAYYEFVIKAFYVMSAATQWIMNLLASVSENSWKRIWIRGGDGGNGVEAGAW